MRRESDAFDLADRLAEFKNDPEKYRQVSEFVDQLILQAKKEAEIKNNEKEKSHFVSINVYLCS